jgi:hypothetical protein
LELKYTDQLVTPENLRWKVLIVGRPGIGKTSWASTAPDVGIAACETGHGKGTLSLAHSKDAQGNTKRIAYAEPATFIDFRAICNNTFEPFIKMRSIALDSLTYMTKSFIKDYVLATFPPKNQKEAMRRQAGVPSGFDYGDIADVTRTLLGQLINQNKHVIVTCLEKQEKDSEGNVTGLVPDLPGALQQGAPAMFDTVLYLKSRKYLRDTKDPKSVVDERYFVTVNDGFHLGKDRNSDKFKSFLAPEEVFNPDKGIGVFEVLFTKILAGHALASKAAVPA